MRRFRFTLEALQRLRQRQEKHALQQYGQAVVTHQEAVRRLEEVEADCESSWAVCRDNLAGNAPAAYIAQLESYCRWIEQCKYISEQAVQHAERVCKQRWLRLQLARQAREVVDKFMLRQRQRYDRELMREEQKLLDDLANRHLSATASWSMSEELMRN